jgi:Beta-galactosidase
MRRWTWLRRVLPAGVSGLLLLSAVASSAVEVRTVPEVSTPPLVGFSFSPWAVSWASGQTPTRALGTLLDRLRPDVVRLPVYWSEVEPSEGEFDFTAVDDLLDTVTAYDQTAGRPARVLLVVGARNLNYPELRLPGWLDESAAAHLSTLYRSAEYQEYLMTSFARFASLPILYAWQIENEPLDNVTTDRDGSVAVSARIVSGEMALLRSIDRQHLALVTTYNSSHLALDQKGASPLAWLYSMFSGPKPAGHPARALQLGDVLGLDVYVVTPNTPLTEDTAIERIGWKAETIDYWAQKARASGRDLWLTEMQAGPWANAPGFTPTDLVLSADLYRDRGASLVLLWGVEGWLHSDQWMRAGRSAIAILRSTSDPGCAEIVGHRC